MTPHRLLAAAHPPITPDRGSGANGRDVLPHDLLEQTSVRVRTASLSLGAVWLFVLFMNNVVIQVFGPSALSANSGWPWPGNLFSALGAAASFALAWLVPRLRDRPQLVIDLGLAYEVVSALLVALVTLWLPSVESPTISWVCALILIYPAIAPATPRKTLLASLAAASMVPVGLGLAWLRGVEFVTNPFSLVWFISATYVCALLAVIPSRIIRGLGRQVRRERELGSYRLGEPLGHGGMGRVYRATHRMLARPAAVKLMRPEVLGDGASDAARVLVERFRREAEAAAMLNSVHTVELYDFGVADDGTFFFAMELLDGLDLEALVERFGPVPPERAIHLLLQVCDSLAEAHSCGLVHRDIKPSNIQTCRMGLTVDFVKVLDFGLVKAAPHVAPDQAKLTIPDIVMGTPAYMAPEVAGGDEVIDRRADLYALGCVAYWLLTGRAVFEAPSAMVMMLRHLETAPEPPSAHAPQPVPWELDELVLACLAKRPAERPADAREVARRLAACPVREPWTEERAQEWWRGHVDERAATPVAGADRAVIPTPDSALRAAR